jgi:septal ring factor EnvC (AmiA/AmiB activator)
VAGSFRSEVISIERELFERLRHLEAIHGPKLTTEHKIPVFSEVFQAVILRSRLYGRLLKMIKQEYESAFAEKCATKCPSCQDTPAVSPMESPLTLERAEGILAQNVLVNSETQDRMTKLEVEVESRKCEMARADWDLQQVQRNLAANAKKKEELEKAIAKERKAMELERKTMHADYVDLQDALGETFRVCTERSLKVVELSLNVHRTFPECALNVP